MRQTTSPSAVLLARVLLSVSVLCATSSPTRSDASELRHSPIVRAVERARSSIVNIHGEKNLTENRVGSADSQRRVNGMGTGVLIDERGYIITNHHVVEGVLKIQVTMADESNHVARMIAYDAITDLAIIKIDDMENLSVIDIGTSSDLLQGESVIAVGNAYGYEHTVSEGIISALHRSVQVSDAQSYDDLIQTDASINPGNSGGPLLNIDGEMIGINVAVRAGAQGIGFAIPVDKAMAIAAKLMSGKRSTNNWHGLALRDQPGAKQPGAIVEEITSNSPAAKCGLKAGDIVTAVGKHNVARSLDVELALLDTPSGETVTMTVERDNAPLSLQLVLASMPNAIPAAQLVEGDSSWSTLGMKLEPIGSRQFQQYRSRYKGGLTVVNVRPDSPAAQNGIRRGDVLVGMHIWSMMSLTDVTYVLNRPDLVDLQPIKFYILRDNETLYGTMHVSHQQPTQLLR